jgi:DNA helicase-2/ATP-dependent DNA helicase PcrA
MSRLAAPSPYQEAIFRFVEKGSGHGVVKATAGSGKTTTLVEAAHRLPKGTRACFLAFNVHTAKELERRLPAQVEARTVHSLGFAIMARHVGRDRKLRVEDQKYRSLAEHYLKRDDRTWRLPPSELRACVGYLKDLARLIRLELATPEVLPELAVRYRLQPPDPALTETLHELVWAVLDAGERQAREGLIDFADMLFSPVLERLAPSHPFDFVFVDEAQDLSKVQLALVLRCVTKGGRLLFVGDPRQAIYGFSGADAYAVERIVEVTKATVLPLTVTYRCPVSHVQLARAFAPEMQAAPGAAQGSVRCMSETVLGAHARPGDLVLCRVNAPLVKGALHLIQQGTPARVEGRDLAGKLIADAKAAFGTTLENWRPKLKRYEARELERLTRSRVPADVLERMMAQREDELESLRAVVGFATRDGVVNTPDLTARIDTLFRDAGSSVTFSTVHKAKGKEAGSVFILYPHLMPLPYAGSKEDRLGEQCVQFVAVTRSQRELTFVEADNAPLGSAWWRQRTAPTSPTEAPHVAVHHHQVH